MGLVMTSEKIALVLDTNILFKQCKAEENMDDLSIEPYDNAIDMIEQHDLVEKINVFIPEIVLLEHSNHKLEKMKKECEISINFLENLIMFQK